MRVFLDVGGHDGQTLEEVMRPVYAFDQIYCFEPMPLQFANLTRRFSEVMKCPKLLLCNYGILDTNGNLPVYGTNSNMGASIYDTKIDIEKGVVTECRFVRASDFFRENVKDGDFVLMKLNCEGSECRIINDLIESKEIWKVTGVMVDFDVRKIFPTKHRRRKRHCKTLEILVTEGWSLRRRS